MSNRHMIAYGLIAALAAAGLLALWFGVLRERFGMRRRSRRASRDRRAAHAALTDSKPVHQTD